MNLKPDLSFPIRSLHCLAHSDQLPNSPKSVKQEILSLLIKQLFSIVKKWEVLKPSFQMPPKRYFRRTIWHLENVNLVLVTLELQYISRDQRVMQWRICSEKYVSRKNSFNKYMLRMEWRSLNDREITMTIDKLPYYMAQMMKIVKKISTNNHVNLDVS